MQIFRNHLDMILEIGIIKNQINFIKDELKYWFGIDLEEETGIPLGGPGSLKFGANTSLIQADKKIKSYYKLQLQLKQLEYAKIRTEISLEQFTGLEYKIAYKRIIEKKTHKQIAEELGYSEQYIRKRWANVKSNKEATEALENV